MTLVISHVFSLKQRINSDNEKNFRIRWLGRALELINLEEKTSEIKNFRIGAGQGGQ